VPKLNGLHRVIPPEKEFEKIFDSKNKNYFSIFDSNENLVSMLKKRFALFFLPSFFCIAKKEGRKKA
jgi:hypothetical protein